MDAHLRGLDVNINCRRQERPLHLPTTSPSGTCWPRNKASSETLPCTDCFHSGTLESCNSWLKATAGDSMDLGVLRPPTERPGLCLEMASLHTQTWSQKTNQNGSRDAHGLEVTTWSHSGLPFLYMFRLSWWDTLVATLSTGCASC